MTIKVGSTIRIAVPDDEPILGIVEEVAYRARKSEFVPREVKGYFYWREKEYRIDGKDADIYYVEPIKAEEV